MLFRRTCKFFVGRRSQSPTIFDLKSHSSGKIPNILSWPQCQTKCPGDADDNSAMCPDPCSHSVHIHCMKNAARESRPTLNSKQCAKLQRRGEGSTLPTPACEGNMASEMFAVRENVVQ